MSTTFASFIRVGRGWRDSHTAQDRRAAKNVAAQLAAAGRWSGERPITIHNPYRLFHSLSRTPRERHDARYNIGVRAGVHDLQAGVDFDIAPPQCEGYDRNADPLCPPKCERPATAQVHNIATNEILDMCARCAADYAALPGWVAVETGERAA